MNTLAYLTLDDGTLVDLESDGTTVTIRAGLSLTPAERPVVLTLTYRDVVEFAGTLMVLAKRAADRLDDDQLREFFRRAVKAQAAVDEIIRNASD